MSIDLAWFPDYGHIGAGIFTSQLEMLNYKFPYCMFLLHLIPLYGGNRRNIQRYPYILVPELCDQENIYCQQIPLKLEGNLENKIIK